jgi:hypothetical protein
MKMQDGHAPLLREIERLKAALERADERDNMWSEQLSDLQAENERLRERCLAASEWLTDGAPMFLRAALATKASGEHVPGFMEGGDE